MARFLSFSSRRGRRWATVEGAPALPGVDPTSRVHTEPPPARSPGPSPGPPPTPSPHEPRRHYPWHDDPDYDPSVYRHPAPSSWVPPDVRDGAPWSAAGPHPVEQRTQVGPHAPAAAHAWQPTPPRQPTQPSPPTEPVPVAGHRHGSTRPEERATQRVPRKLTVTRVAAMRSRQITGSGIRAFHRAASADGADRSGLTALTYATMLTFAVDASVAVSLANTLFFAAATAESKANVALYLAITVAPFAVVAPVIGPFLDRLQRGRRAALAVSFAGRAVLAVVMAFTYDSWGLYPAALGVLVLGKSFHVLKAAVTPRVLPPTITLVTVNSRLTMFGMVAGGVLGAGAAGVAALSGSPGALVYTAVLAVAGTALCLRIPRRVESTAGEIPAALRSTTRGRTTRAGTARGGTSRGRRSPMGRAVAVSLWGNGAIRTLTGFLTLFIAFVVKEQTAGDAKGQLLLLGIVGAAAGVGSFAGNATGSRLRFRHSDTVILSCVAAAFAVAVLATVVPGLATAAAVGLVGATASALAKVCLDAVIQRDLPEESRASAFGRSETVLQLAWVFGGALGVLLPHDSYQVGFAVVAAAVALIGIQTALTSRGRSMVPLVRAPAPVGATVVR